MRVVKVAAAVLNQTPLDWNGNSKRILASIGEARDRGASILCLPELCICGYGCEDAFLSPAVAETSLAILVDEILPASAGMLVSVGLPLRYRRALFNTACLLVDGHLAGFAAKQYLARSGIHYEPRWFEAWPEDQQASVEIGGRQVPLGDIFFECDGVRIGFEICEDAWAAERPGGDLAARGVDILLNPSASHFAFGKYEVRKRLVLEGSRAFGVTYVYSNLIGNEAGRAIYDGGALIASGGQMLAAGPRFSFLDLHVTTASIDLDAARARRARDTSVRPDLNEDGPRRVMVEGFSVPISTPEVCDPKWPVWEQRSSLKEEEFTRAEALALFDYLRKSRSSGFVVSLSGGADSAAVACLVWCMLGLARDELGDVELSRRIGRPELAGNLALDSLLTCAYQATANSSQTTRDAARQVSASLGAGFHEIDVEELVQGYVARVEKALERPLTWDRDDLALQNIQARTRAPSVWMLANLHNALLLATSNRSEAAVGYATMDGDTCGGLSPIAGVDKTFLRQWLRWMERTGPIGLQPIKALEAVNAQQPTAELKPIECGQTDESDLMPYELLDAIEQAAIRDKQMPLEVYQLLQGRFTDVHAVQLAEWIERFFRLWSRNQWKRERYAPSFHLDDENLDPRTWCRFPILSGGFERELAELLQHVQSAEGG
ncbi:MAG: NAD(+) synthase [Deltaproteobacteria bacterium]|nr:NAD(+) synthase [Deltaproteobacteria bacterium]